MGKYISDFRAGDTVKKRISLQTKDADDLVTAIDLTGYTFSLTISEDFDSAPALSVAFLAGSHENDEPTAGIVFIELESAMTRELVPGKYYYDVQMQTPAGDVTTLLPPKNDFKDRLQVLPNLSPEIIA